MCFFSPAAVFFFFYVCACSFMCAFLYFSSHLYIVMFFFFYYLAVASCTYTDRIANHFPEESLSSNSSSVHTIAMWRKRWEKLPSASAHSHTSPSKWIHSMVATIFCTVVCECAFFSFFAFASYLALAMTLLVPIFIRLDKLLLCGAMARGHLYTFHHFIYLLRW